MRQSIKRIFNVGWLNFKRNGYVSLGTTGIMILVLLLFSVLIGLSFVSNKIVENLNQKIDVTAYFKIDASEGEILSVQDDLYSLSEVGGVEYISRDQAFEDFKIRYAGDALIQDSLAELDSNPLQASLNIQAINPSQFASIVTFLEGNKFRTLIDKIDFYENEQVIARVQSISDGVQNWGFLLTMILAIMAVLITFNTIRLTIYGQRQEIEIMRLVGGSKWHIKAPYLVEGGIYGVFAAAVAIAIFYPAVYIVSPKVESLMPGVGLMSYFVSNIFQFTLVIVVIGILLGVVSSFVAIRRFLKV